jgi:hypothetical protein
MLGRQPAKCSHHPADFRRPSEQPCSRCRRARLLFEEETIVTVLVERLHLEGGVDSPHRARSRLIGHRLARQAQYMMIVLTSWSGGTWLMAAVTQSRADSQWREKHGHVVDYAHIIHSAQAQTRWRFRSRLGPSSFRVMLSPCAFDRLIREWPRSKHAD